MGMFGAPRKTPEQDAAELYAQLKAISDASRAKAKPFSPEAMGWSTGTGGAQMLQPHGGQTDARTPAYQQVRPAGEALATTGSHGDLQYTPAATGVVPSTGSSNEGAPLGVYDPGKINPGIPGVPGSQLLNLPPGLIPGSQGQNAAVNNTPPPQQPDRPYQAGGFSTAAPPAAPSFMPQIFNGSLLPANGYSAAPSAPGYAMPRTGQPFGASAPQAPPPVSILPQQPIASTPPMNSGSSVVKRWLREFGDADRY